MILPISPQSLVHPKERYISECLIETLNELIQFRWNPEWNNAVFGRALVYEHALARHGSDRSEFAKDEQEKFATVIKLFESCGWKVTYETPPYDEEFDPFFTFKATKS